jgi:ectoine hydroxylase-related dioxygenase (phytanoyl-CoA dioxygenase family)
MAITDDQFEQFRSEGYTVVHDLFTRAECEAIIERHDHAAFALDLGRPEDGQMTYRPMVHLADEVLAAVACDARWAQIVLPIVGPDARLYWEQAVSKPPGTGTELPWHQDNGYTPLDPEMYLTCWLSLDDSDALNGGMQVIPRSHLGGTLPHHDDADRNPYFRVGHDGGPDDGTSVDVPAGSVLVFSSLILHRSGPNTTTDRQRRAWILQYCPADARSALSGRQLDDRLRVAVDGEWLDTPYRDRDIDVLSMLANYQRERP